MQTTERGTPSAVLSPIFIPSRHRAGQRRATWHGLLASGLDCTVVVEAADAAVYREAMQKAAAASTSAAAATCSSNSSGGAATAVAATAIPSAVGSVRIAVLPLADQGVSYARNYILDHLAPRSGWFWIMDDDIKSFRRCLPNGAVAEVSAREAVTEVLARVTAHPDVCLFSLEYENFSFRYKPGDYLENSYNNIAVCMDLARLPSPLLRYRFRLREDYDFTLQIIRAGGRTLRWKDVSFRVPQMAKCAGGMTDYYQNAKTDIREQNRLFVTEWPAVSSEVVKGTALCERFDVSVSWRLLNPQREACPRRLLVGTAAAVAPRLLGPESATAATAAAMKQSTRRIGTTKRAGAGRSRVRRRAASYDDSSDEDDSEEHFSSESAEEEESSSSSSDDSSDDGDTRTGAAVTRKRARNGQKGRAGGRNPRALGLPTASKEALAPPPPRREPVPAGWRGWAVEAFRVVAPDVAAMAGLALLASPRPGDSVAVIPASFAAPSLVVGTVIAVRRGKDGACVYDVCPDARGVPEQRVACCYAAGSAAYVQVCREALQRLLDDDAANASVASPAGGAVATAGTPTSVVGAARPELLGDCGSNAACSASLSAIYDWIESNRSRVRGQGTGADVTDTA